MTEQTAANDHQLAAGDPRAAKLLENWRLLDERYQQVVVATAGALAAYVKFRRIDPETRRLVGRLLDDPSDTDLRALNEHPDGAAISDWLLSLPSYLDGEQRDNADEQHSLADSAPAEPPPSVDLRGDVSRLFHRSQGG